MEETSDATTQRQHPAAPVPLPPPAHRRAKLRVREVSSRFMSPLVAFNANPTPTPTPTPAAPESQRSKSVKSRQPQQQYELEPRSIDENWVPETARSLDSSTPLAPGGGGRGGSAAHAHHQSAKSSSSAPRKQQQQQLQRVKPPYKENDAKTELQQPRLGSGRPDTPIVAGADRDRDRIVPSRYRLASQSLHRPSSATNYCVNMNGGGGAPVTASAAAKLLREATSTDHPLIDSSSSRTAFGVQSNTNNRMMPPDLRSSMPEVDVLPTVSTRWQHVARSFNNLPVAEICDNDSNSLRSTTSPCSRSLVNLPQSNSENPSSSSSSSACLSKAGDPTASKTPSKTSLTNQVATLCLPSHLSSLKQGAAADARKGKKLFHHQDDVKHALKLLYNHYLQWRFANAKSEVSMLAQKKEAEGQLFSLGSKISQMREVVKNSHIELNRWQRIKTLLTTVESQMPYLDEWSTVAEDYSHSLSGVTDALLNLSLRLPISGGVKLQVDLTELKEILDSAVKVIELITFCIQSFMVKAEDMESLVSELARIMGGERAHIQECGDSILKSYASQVGEWSLRGHLIQFLGRKNRQQQKNSSQFP
ncbi:protein ENDOSPERM DEFECTIVE 1 isoform X1 [Coffea arabica]|uniref:Protein ENDOSPERM DEFECTIVE 1 isoform X1 n=1 Tax=Coffea arabica TaxID=13443 RepID=A0A6P6U584_COFAR